MKTRTGFVSNSSSSSFIIAFNKKPESIDKMKQILFGDEKIFHHPYEKTGYLTKKVAETVYNDILNQKSKNQEEVIEELGCGWIDHPGKDGKKFFKKNKDCEIFVVEYSDNDGPFYCAMEHGDAFDKIPHIRVSKH